MRAITADSELRMPQYGKKRVGKPRNHWLDDNLEYVSKNILEFSWTDNSILPDPIKLLNNDEIFKWKTTKIIEAAESHKF